MDYLINRKKPNKELTEYIQYDSTSTIFFYRQNGPLLKETYFFNKIRKKCVRMIITNSESQNGGALLEAKRRKEAKKVIQGVSMVFGV